MKIIAGGEADKIKKQLEGLKQTAENAFKRVTEALEAMNKIC